MSLREEKDGKYGSAIYIPKEGDSIFAYKKRGCTLSLIKWSILEYSVIEYIHHPIVFIKHSPVHDNVLGTKIIGKKVNDLEPETVVVFIPLGK